MSVPDRFLPDAELRSALEGRFASAARAARDRGRPVLASITFALPVPPADPRAIVAAPARRGEPWFLWSSPWSSPCPPAWSRRSPRPLHLAGFGAAATLRVAGGRFSLEDGDGRPIDARSAGRSRFGAVERARAWLLDGALSDGRGPILAGGFAFDPRGGGDPDFPAALLRLPRVLLATRGARAAMTLSDLVFPRSDPRRLAAGLLEALDDAMGAQPMAEGAPSGATRIEAEPDPAAWMRLVDAARRRIGDGAIEKVVLARRCRIRAARAFDPHAIHAALAERYPACIGFAFGRGAGTFLGASPEMLVRQEGLRIASGSLAGTTARGRSPAEDRRLARALVESKKEQEEHAIVLRAIRESLATLCREIRSPESPRLVRLENVQHLHTPVTGTLRSPGSILSVVEALHPTPAVGGWPRAESLRVLRALEPFDRGWYAGPVGWVDAAGNGEFAVGIRSARIRGNEADLFAGAGIVHDSDPSDELRETRAKLRAVLDVLLESQ